MSRYLRRVQFAFAVAIIMAVVMFVDIVAFSVSGSAPIHPAVALFGDAAAVLLAVVAGVAFVNRPRA